MEPSTINESEVQRMLSIRKSSYPTRSSRKRLLGVVVSVAAVGFATLPASSTEAKVASPAFGPKESPLGKPYAGWLQDWAKWAFGGPTATNPLLNFKACDTFIQPDPTRVWFLHAASGGKAEATCSVPAGLPILVSPGGTAFWEKPEDAAKLPAKIANFKQEVSSPRLKVDNVVVNAKAYLTQTPDFAGKIEAPEFGPVQGDVTFRSKAWVVMLKPLSAGAHIVEASVLLRKLDDKGEPVSQNGKPVWDPAIVTFNLNVGTGPAPSPTPTTAPATTIAPTTAPTTAPAPAPAAIVFKDDFEDPKSGWLDDNGGDWTMGYIGGKYQITANAGASGQVGPDHVGQPNQANSRTELEFELDSAIASFVIHGYAELIPGGPKNAPPKTVEEEYFYIGFNPLETYGYVSLGGRRLGLPRKSISAEGFKAVNKVVIEARGEPGKPGGSIKAWLNGSLVVDVTGIMPKGTGFTPALEAGKSLGSKATVKIDNLVVTKLA
jgi:hypothetical protein